MFYAQVKRRRYFEDTQDIKKRKLSARFKKVYKCVPCCIGLVPLVDIPVFWG